MPIQMIFTQIEKQTDLRAKPVDPFQLETRLLELEARLSKPPPASHHLKPPTDDTDRQFGKTRHCLAMRGTTSFLVVAAQLGRTV